jgi:hypothetical protein
MSSKDIVISPPDAEEIRAEYSGLVEMAERLEIHSKSRHKEAMLCLVDLKTAQNAVRDRMDPIIKHAFKTHRGLTSLKNDLLRPIDDAYKIANAKIDNYEQEQEELASAAEENGDDPFALPAPIVEPALAKVDGVSKRVTWKAEVMDAQMALEYMLEQPGNEYPEKTWDKLAKVLESELGPLVRAQQAAFRMPGVKAVRETSRAVKTT